MQNKKDRRVLKWEGMYAKECMSPVSTCLYSCACSLNVPVYLEPSSPILKHYPSPSTHFVFHVIHWGSETPVWGLQDLLSPAQSGLQKTEYFRRPVLWNILVAAVELKQGGTEMRAGGVASRAFSVLVVLLCLSSHSFGSNCHRNDSKWYLVRMGIFQA